VSPSEAGHPLHALGVRLALLSAVIVGCGVLVGGLFLPTALAVTDVVDSVKSGVLDIPPLPREFVPPAERSILYAADGTPLETIFFEENRNSFPLAEIPAIVRNAVIATEDSEFWDHRGINYRAIIRAAFTNARAGEIQGGGSTITQQYVKNVVLSGDRTFERKIKEAVYAVELEQRITKEEILQHYLNEIYLGNGVYGVGTAAEYYFGKDVRDLQAAEAAVLAGMIRDPRRNDPIAFPDASQRRRDIVLDQMEEQGYLTRDEAQDARSRPIELNVTQLEEPESPFFADWIKRLLVNEDTARGLGTQLDALRALGDTPEERIRQVFQGGLRIHTTIDPEFQRLAEEAIDEHVTEPLTDPMAAIVSVEPGTGAVRTMAIGPKTHGTCDEPDEVDEDTGKLLCSRTKFNPAVPADAGSNRVGRQPGSSFKPYVIATALELGLPPGWEVEATGPQTINGCLDNGAPWTVNNSGGNGLRNMYSGVAGSSNVFHARLMAEIGPRPVAELANRVGIKSLDPDNPNQAVCSMALGSTEVFPLEHAAAFATFANEGVYCAPYAIQRIEDKNGKVLWEHTVDCARAIDADVALRVVDIMKGPVNGGGTAPWMASAMSPYPVRGKTGTTNDYVDAWFVGFTRQLATAAWLGYENGIERYQTEEQAITACPGQHRGANALEGNVCIARHLMSNVTISGRYHSRIFGSTISAPMWRDYMSRAMQRFEPQAWDAPSAAPAATVPDVLAAADLDAAKELLERAGLNWYVQDVEHFEPAGTMLAQTPPGGTRVSAGSIVVIDVSDGLGVAPVVPDLVGLTETQAIRLLEERGYVARVLYKDTRDEEQVGRVLAQSPGEGEHYAPGEDAVVIIQVGRARKGKPEPSPSPSPSESASPSPSPSPSEGPGNGGGRGGDGDADSTTP